MRYLQSGSFSNQLGTREAQQNYLNNWERTFQKKPAPKRKLPKAEVKADEAIANR